MKKSQRDRVQEHSPTYGGAYAAKIDVLPAELLEVGERYMEQLKDQVHVQDLLGQRLTTAAIEKALPVVLRQKLGLVKEITRREQLS